MKHSLPPIFTIAKHTYRELVRERLLYGVFLIAALVTAMSFFLSTVSLAQDARVLHNIGLASIHLFAVFISIFVTSTAIGKDLDKRTVYFLFPKPISRGQYVLGKFVGIVLLSITTLFVLGGLFLLGVAFTQPQLVPAVLTNLGYSFLEISLLVALTQLFASFTAPLNASLYGVALYIIGHSLTSVRAFISESGNAALIKLIDACYYLVPNLEKFDVRAATLYGIALTPGQVGWSLAYWLFYTSLLLWLTTLVVRNREF
jgi:ABC-type transport system involved in multi-copper enzyme maturation permease subunit